MGAFRKAGVWLGLVAEEDERDELGYDDDFGDDDFTPVRPRSVSRAPMRLAEPERVREHTSLRERESHTSVREREHAPTREHSSSREHTASREHSLLREQPREHVREQPREHTPAREHPINREHDRLDEVRTERSSVRPISRSSTTTESPVAFATKDSLALAPQTQLRERAVVPDDPAKRYQITTLHPTRYTEARAIGEQFRDGIPVIINLTEMDESDARRLVDFAAGLAFGLRGNIERVTNRVFLLSPANVEVTAEDKAKIAEGGFFDHS